MSHNSPLFKFIRSIVTIISLAGNHFNVGRGLGPASVEFGCSYGYDLGPIWCELDEVRKTFGVFGQSYGYARGIFSYLRSFSWRKKFSDVDLRRNMGVFIFSGYF